MQAQAVLRWVPPFTSHRPWPGCHCPPCIARALAGLATAICLALQGASPSRARYTICFILCRAGLDAAVFLTLCTAHPSLALLPLPQLALCRALVGWYLLLSLAWGMGRLESVCHRAGPAQVRGGESIGPLGSVLVLLMANPHLPFRQVRQRMCNWPTFTQ